MLSCFPLDVLDEIWDVIEAASKGFLTYRFNQYAQFKSLKGEQQELSFLYFPIQSPIHFYLYQTRPILYKPITATRSCKQCRTVSNTTQRDIRSGSTLYVMNTGDSKEELNHTQSGALIYATILFVLRYNCNELQAATGNVAQLS